MLRIVIVDEELPYPPNSGKRIRTLNLIDRLAGRHQLTYLCHRNSDPEELAEAEKHFRGLGIQLRIVNHTVPTGSASRPTTGFYARLAMNLLSPLPYSVQVHCSRQLRRALQRVLAEQAVDLIHCEWTPYAQSVPRDAAPPHVIMAHNVESLIWQRYWQTERHRLRRWYIGRQWKKFERFEEQAFARAARVITVSEEDAALAHRRFGTERLSVVENGVDVQAYTPAGRRSVQERVLYLGSLDWRPNLDAVSLLLDHIFPQLRTQRPQVQLVIAGRRPPQWLVDRARATPGVTLHADVPDVRPLLHAAAVMVVPLRIGGGSRLKILEAAASGLPVVSTPVGAEGLALLPKEHFIRAHVDEMADAIVRCLADRQEAEAMAARARRVVLERYDWPFLANKLDQIWQHCSRDGSPATTRRRQCVA